MTPSSTFVALNECWPCEIDGDSHDAQPQQGATRTRRLKALGIEVVRYTNAEIMNHLEGVYESLLKPVTARRSPQRRDQAAGRDLLEEQVETPSV